MKIKELSKGNGLDHPTIVKIGDDHYVVSKKFHPDCDERKYHIAINLEDGKWFEWTESPEKMFESNTIEYFAPNTRFEIILK